MASMADMLKPKEVKETVLKTVQLDGQAVLKIQQHCDSALPHIVTGQLLGLDVGQTMEVTDCFPFPSAEDDADAAAGSYQLDMMRCLREVNVDNNTVGWYQSSVLGSYQTQEMIETFISYHDSIKKCVCIVYDPQRAARGAVALRAVRLKDAFIQLYKDQKLAGKDLREAGVGWRDVFVEVPIKIHNSSLAQALIADIAPPSGATAGDLERLSLSNAPYMAKTMSSLIECMDDLLAEQGKVSMYHRNSARQQQQIAAWLQKRRQENIARRAAGEEALPEEDPVLFKPIPEPSALDTYLATSQIAGYCDLLSGAAEKGMAKLYLVQGLQKAAARV
ncbi:TIF3H1 [Scenedesmus sp. PABB004]|nr:TIF3H1 [Scenedesmus sp. PABB004]